MTVLKILLIIFGFSLAAFPFLVALLAANESGKKREKMPRAALFICFFIGVVLFVVGKFI